MLAPTLGRGPGRELDAGKVGRVDAVRLTAEGAKLMSLGGLARPGKEVSAWSGCCWGMASEACCAPAGTREAGGAGAAQVAGQHCSGSRVGGGLCL